MSWKCHFPENIFPNPGIVVCVFTDLPVANCQFGNRQEQARAFYGCARRRLSLCLNCPELDSRCSHPVESLAKDKFMGSRMASLLKSHRKVDFSA